MYMVTQCSPGLSPSCVLHTKADGYVATTSDHFSENIISTFTENNYAQCKTKTRFSYDIDRHFLHLIFSHEDISPVFEFASLTIFHRLPMARRFTHSTAITW